MKFKYFILYFFTRNIKYFRKNVFEVISDVEGKDFAGWVEAKSLLEKNYKL